MKSEKGITLIGLIVTIIVLLILAEVTILTLRGENGILNQANEAKNATNKSVAREEIELAVVQALKNKVSSQNEMKAYLEKNLKGSQVSINANNELTISYKNYDFYLDDEWNVNEDTLLARIDSSNYGDFINYGISLDAIQEDADRVNGWKIFYKNDEGTFIITSDYVNIWNEALAKARTDAGMAGTGKYMAYWPDTSYLTKKDSNGNAMIDSNASKFMYNWTGEMKQNNNIAIASLLDTNAWRHFLTDGATMAIGSPTLEMFRASWNEKKYSSGTHTKLQISQDSYGYNVGLNNNENIEMTTRLVNTKSDAAYGDTLYYPHAKEGVWNDCYGYWLASPANYGSDSIIRVCNNGDIIYHYYYSGYSSGVRPVVFLPSNIKGYKDSNGVWQIEK